MSSTQHQLIEQCATRLRGIVEALDNIHDNTPHRWSTDLDDVHSSAESLLALIKDQAPTQAAQGLAGAALAQPSPAQAEQAEAESPEVVAHMYQNDETGIVGFVDQQQVDWGFWSNNPRLHPAGELMTVAQHDRIVGALRADRDSWAEQAEQRLADWDEMRKERDAALARVAEFEAQAQYSAGYAEARQCVNCRHIGINDAADYAACHDCRWTGPEPDEDKCPGCASENCMAAACPECGGRYELVAEANIATPVAQAGQVPQAWLDVQTERRRQITAEGWTPEHDDEHSHGQMARASACYALAGSSAPNDGTAALLVSLAWPWDQQWWKPSTARRDLVKACALGLAEIERLDRAAASQGGPSDA
ncbi:hypothetical protein [Pseudomonas aeruginosa]|uniref:hypothetical protein n=1 Tax=Pseudomonas aeruginosa TaxID=287 RepID=UPI001364D4F8|nr:hypothetical protein [Pseudomonas aeruginosa]NBK32433.1 hypothetical protein [Pseudomonas aeruginosa]NBY86544.1 hypothetical protein [Pseudomonas aeruginosa]